MPSRPARRRHRSGAGAAGVVVALGLVLGACGGVSKPSVQAIESGLVKSGALHKANLTEPQLRCEANVFHTYGTASSLSAFVDSGETAADAAKIRYPASDKAALRKDAKACVTGG